MQVCRGVIRAIICSLLAFALPSGSQVSHADPMGVPGCGAMVPGGAMLGSQTPNGCQPNAPTGIPSYTGAVATNGRLTDSALGSPGQQMQTRSRHISRVPISSLKLAIPNWGVQTGVETGSGGSAQVHVSVEYPAGVCTVATFSGNPTGTIPNLTTLYTDPIAVTIPANTAFFVRIWFSSVNILYTVQEDTANGEGFEFGTTTPDKTSSCAAIGTGVAMYYPAALIGTTTSPSICIVGDSRAHGYGDTYNGTTGLQGDIERSIGTSFAFVNTASNGNSTATMIAGSTLRQDLLRWCSHGIVETGINDLIAGTISTTVVANNQTILGYFGSRKTYITTLEPVSSSTDGWLTLANQSNDPVGNANLNNYNAAVRATPAGFKGFFELSNVLSSSPGAGLWTVAPTPPYTADGIHENQAGYLLIPTANAIPAAAFTYP